jgi:hypothetical protein
MTLDITMTSILRPKVIERTLFSLKEHLKFSGDIRLILSVDPIGEQVAKKSILKVARKYFPVFHKYNDTASFENSVLWLWNQVESLYFLHWEDDKVLLKDLDIDWCIKKLEENNTIASMSFPTIRIKKKDKIFFWTDWELKDDIYITNKYGHCFGTRPHLIRKEFIKGSLLYITNRRNIEKQFRYSNTNFCNKFLSKWLFSLYSESQVYIDIGNDWKKIMKIKKSRQSKTHCYVPVVNDDFDIRSY